MKFLVAGFGSIGRRHFRNLLALGEDDIILYRTGRSTLPDDELDGFTVETDLHRALAHKPDAVIVANPTALHMDVAVPAAKAGCHIFLEKPISHNLERWDELTDALKQGGGKGLVGFQFRFHPTLRKANELLCLNAIGRPVSAQAHWGEYLPAWHPWEDYRKSYSARQDLGGGVGLTLCHPLDYLRWLLGEAQVIHAWAGQVSDLELDVPDTADYLLKMNGEALAHVHLDYYQRPPAHTLEIAGTDGLMRWDNADGILNVYRSVTGEWEQYAPPASFERNEMFLDLMRHFIAVVRGSEEPLCTLEDGRRALELALAAQAG